MKILLSLLLLTSFLSFGSAFAKEAIVKTKKKSSPFASQKYANVICNQKDIPMKVEQTLNSHLLTVKFTAQRKIDQFTIKEVRGIEGVKVTKFQEQNVTDLDKGESLTSAVELSDFSGLVYVVFDVEVTLNGVLTVHSIPIPVGTLNEKQISARAKNIKEIKADSQTKGNTNQLTTPTKKIHEMQVQ